MSVRFDADGEHYTSAVPAVSNYTVTFWGKLAVDRNAFSTFWGSDDGTTGTYHIFQTDGTGTDVDHVGTAAGVAGPVMTVDTWYRFGITCNGTSVTVYHASGPGGSLTSASGTLNATTGFTTFRVGASVFSGEWLNGNVANLKHYSAVLTESEIETELASWTAVRTANLVRHHKFQVAETTDYSGNGNTLTGGAGTSTEADPPIGPVDPLRIPIQTFRVP
jgi:hypothetical protein